MLDSEPGGCEGGKARGARTRLPSVSVRGAGKAGGFRVRAQRARRCWLPAEVPAPTSGSPAAGGAAPAARPQRPAPARGGERAGRRAGGSRRRLGARVGTVAGSQKMRDPDGVAGRSKVVRASIIWQTPPTDSTRSGCTIGGPRTLGASDGNAARLAKGGSGPARPDADKYEMRARPPHPELPCS